MQGEPIPKEAGARSQNVGDIFDGRTTLLALGGILGANVVMTVVIVSFGFGIQLILSIFR